MNFELLAQFEIFVQDGLDASLEVGVVLFVGVGFDGVGADGYGVDFLVALGFCFEAEVFTF